jgi:hypothetical protein
MYFVSGRKFRLAAKDTITCRRCRGRPPVSGSSISAGPSGTKGRSLAYGMTQLASLSQTTLTIVT